MPTYNASLLLVIASALYLCPDVGLGFAQTSNVTQSDRLLRQAVKAIRKQEQAVLNIHFASSDWIRTGVPHQAAMVLAGETHAVATYDGLPCGNCRIEVSRQLTPWTNGRAAYYASAYLVAYNGRVGTFLQTMSGTPIKMSPVEWGQVCGHLPSRVLQLAGGTGWSSSIFGFTSTLNFGDNPRFSNYISLDQKHFKSKAVLAGGIKFLPWLHASWKRLNGKRFLRIVRIGHMGKRVFLLDPRKGYSITKVDWYEWMAKKNQAGKVYVIPATWVLSQFRVKGFFEPIRGVFFPRLITSNRFELKAGGKVPITAETIAVSHVKVNDPTVNKHTYVIQFPRDATVKDEATGEVIKVGGTPSQQMMEIEKVIHGAQ